MRLARPPNQEKAQYSKGIVEVYPLPDLILDLRDKVQAPSKGVRNLILDRGCRFGLACMDHGTTEASK